MVKSGLDRAKRSALKNDPYVLMIRNKHEHFSIIDHFATLTYKQYAIDSIISQVSNSHSLVWGQKGRYHDLTMRLFWKGIDNLDDWLTQGLDASTYNDTKTSISEIVNFYYICAYPKSKLIASISINPSVQTMPFSTMEDWLNEITALSEQQTQIAAPMPNGVSVLECALCSHNVANSVLIFLNNPVVAVTGYGVNPILHRALAWGVANSVLIFLNNPVVAVTGYGVNPILHRALAWGLVPNLYPIFSNSKALYAVQNVTLTIGISSAHPNVNNFQPILNSSVAHS